LQLVSRVALRASLRATGFLAKCPPGMAGIANHARFLRATKASEQLLALRQAFRVLVRCRAVENLQPAFAGAPGRRRTVRNSTDGI